MKIYEIFERDPRTIGLANQGQARIRGDRSEKAQHELRMELESFVCDGQYGQALRRILERYIECLGRDRQDAAWVSGFFGSGKSHLLKMLGHLWVDTSFPDGTTARSLVRGLPDDVRALFKELDTSANRMGVPTFAAMGTLPAGSGDYVRATILSIVLEAQGLPSQVPQAEFVFWARERGFEEGIKGAVEAAGKGWLDELNNLYVSSIIAKALLALDPAFKSEAGAREALRAQFPPLKTDIDSKRFISAIRKALIAPNGALPLGIFIFDEAQQYIADSQDRAQLVTEAAEAIRTELDSRVILVASGQSALSTMTQHLVKLRDRFPISAQLSDADVEAVTRKVLLAKKPSAMASLKANLDKNAGEISRHLRGTKISARPEDSKTIEADYPLLPSRRRFWEECFRAVDAAGTQSQLRSQLTILHGTLKDHADRDLGAVIPADALYDAIAPNLVNTGVLPNEISTRIAKLDDRTEEGILRRRICALVFLIGKLGREKGVDIGVRATPSMLADLLVDDLNASSAALRAQVEEQLSYLHTNGTIMQVGDEYRLQTTEGAEWDRAFREKVVALNANAAEVEERRIQLFSTRAQKIVTEVKLSHGISKTRRSLKLHWAATPPDPNADGVTVWLRDGWSNTESEVGGDARRRGADDAVVHFFLPKKASDNLKKHIVEAEAAQKVLDQKGAPGTNEGRDARESIMSRKRSSEELLGEVLSEILRFAKVFQGGGNEVAGLEPRDRIQSAAQASLSRLYPRFSEADHTAWETVLKRAKEGNDEPFRAIGWTGPTEDHPVCKEVIATIGAGAVGTKVRKTLEAAPFGWSRDAIDAALIALNRRGVLRATRNGKAVPVGALDQNAVPATEFRPEKVVVSIEHKLAVRQLMATLGVPVKNGEEETRIVQCLDILTSLARKAGGSAPLPAPPDVSSVESIRSMSSNEQMVALAAQKDGLLRNSEQWRHQGERAEKRQASWQRLQRLSHQGKGLPVATELQPDIQAIIDGRSLLDPTDQTEPIIGRLATALRQEIAKSHEMHTAALTKGIAELDADESWKKLKPEDRSRILRERNLVAPAPPDVKTDEGLLAELDHANLASRIDAAAAITERVLQARAEAAKILSPQARAVRLRPATLSTEVEVNTWLAEQKAMLLDAVKNGPVIVG